MASIVMDVKKVMRRVTFKVKIQNATELIWRMKMAIILNKLSGWIAGCNIEFDPKMRYRCSQCDGKGKITTDFDPVPWSYLCPGCNGRGVIDG